MKRMMRNMVLVLAIMSLFMSSTVMAASGSVMVFEDTPDIPGLNPDGATRSAVEAQWEALDLSGQTQTTRTFYTSDASLVLNMNNSNTEKQSMVIEGYFIPEQEITQFQFQSDDGVKVFVYDEDMTLLASESDWELQENGAVTFTTTLEAMTLYFIRIEYFDWGGHEKLITDLPTARFFDEEPFLVRYYDDPDEDPIHIEYVVEDELAQGHTVQKDDYVFEYWMDKATNEPYEFSDPVVSDLDLVAQWRPEFNLWVSVDDVADAVYIDGNLITFTPDLYDDSVSHWGSVNKEYIENVGNDAFVAAKARDTHNVISGFNLVLQLPNGEFVETHATLDGEEWYYYFNPENGNDGVPPTYTAPNGDTFQWYEAGYPANDWSLVEDVTPHNNWVDDSFFPANALRNQWIWSVNNMDDAYSKQEGDFIDTPVYLRSSKPTPLYDVTAAFSGVSAATATVEGATAITVPSGTSVDLEAMTTEPHYAFAKWTANGIDTAYAASDSAVITEKTDFVAYFELVDYPVEQINTVSPGTENVQALSEDLTFVADGADGIEDPSTLSWWIKEGDGSWTDTGETSSTYTYAGPLTGPLSVEARYDEYEVLYAVSFEVLDGVGGTVDPTYGEYPLNTSVPVTVTPDEGYEFLQWHGAFGYWIQEGGEGDFLYAKEREPLMQILPLADGEFADGAFLVDGSMMDSEDSFQHIMMPTYMEGVNPTVVYAEFALKEYEISVVAETGGTATVNGVSGDTFTHGTPLTFEYTVQSGYRFDGWDVDPLPNSATESAVYTARFSRVPSDNPEPEREAFILTVIVEGPGSVPGFEGQRTVNDRTTVNMLAVIDDIAGARFDGWSGDESGSGLELSFTMDEDKTITATFSQNIGDGDVPEGIPEEEEEFLDEEPVPEALPDIPDDVLPQSGGVPLGVLGVAGMTLIGSGLNLRKKK